jgi:hypothetical protein
MDCKFLLEEYQRATDEPGKVKALNAMIYNECKSQSCVLLEHFQAEPEAIQLSIIFSMRVIADDRAKMLLTEMFTEGQQTLQVRAALTEIVGNLSLHSCRQHLIHQLSHTAPELRFWSCEALGMVGRLEDTIFIRPLLTDMDIGYDHLTVASAATTALNMIVDN